MSAFKFWSLWGAGMIAAVLVVIGLSYVFNETDRNRAEEFIADCKAGGFSSYRIGRELVCVNSDDRVVAKIYD